MSMKRLLCLGILLWFGLRHLSHGEGEFLRHFPIDKVVHAHYVAWNW